MPNTSIHSPRGMLPMMACSVPGPERMFKRLVLVTMAYPVPARAVMGSRLTSKAARIIPLINRFMKPSSLWLVNSITHQASKIMQ